MRMGICPTSARRACVCVRCERALLADRWWADGFTAGVVSARCMGAISYPLTALGWLVRFFTPQPSSLIIISASATGQSMRARALMQQGGRWSVLIVVVAKRKSVQRRVSRLVQEVSESLNNHCTASSVAGERRGCARGFAALRDMCGTHLCRLSLECNALRSLHRSALLPPHGMRP